MTDQSENIFEMLSEALVEATPKPDPERRAANLARARENFSQIRQETGEGLRLTDKKAVRARPAVSERIANMTRKLKYMLAGSTALATSIAALVLVVNQPPHVTQPQGGITAMEAEGFDVVNVAPSQERVEMDVAAAAPQVAQESFAPQVVMNEAKRVREAPSVQSKAAPARSLMADSSMSGAPMAAQAPVMELSRTIAVADDFSPQVESNDRFEGEAINGVKSVSEEPVSTFSIDVDTASWSFARRMIESGQVPGPDMVRIEEMINYFDYGYVPPANDAADPFATHVSVFDAPWNDGKKLVRIGIQGQEPAIEDRPPLDLAFLIDTSGSMNSPDKLGLLKQSFLMMLEQLRPEDRVGIVAYAGSAGVVLEMTQASDADLIEAALANLSAGGSTAGAAGLRAAYDLIGNAKEEGRIGRVILATDGDFNVGMSSTEEMKTFIEGKRDDGAYLSVLGFGQGNYNDALMQTLAQNGNGQAAYIDTLSEARKVLVEQLSGALFPIANDVKIQVEFNPGAVAEYRLIGYETRALKREDFNNDKIDAGEIGAGHQVTALYEITLVGSDAREINPLRYGGENADAVPSGEGELGFVNLRYKMPGDTQSILIGTPINQVDGPADKDAEFATAIAGFGQLMKDDRYLGDWGYDEAAKLAAKSMGDDPFGYRHEAVQLIHLMRILDR